MKFSDIPASFKMKLWLWALFYRWRRPAVDQYYVAVYRKRILDIANEIL